MPGRGMKSMEKQRAPGQSWQRRGIFALVSKRPLSGSLEGDMPEEEETDTETPEP